MNCNPLIQAPHVPQRINETPNRWAEFTSSDQPFSNSQHQHARQGSRLATSIWSQSIHSPPIDPRDTSRTAQQTKRQAGPLQPCWLQEQGHQQPQRVVPIHSSSLPDCQKAPEIQKQQQQQKELSTGHAGEAPWNRPKQQLGSDLACAALSGSSNAQPMQQPQACPQQLLPQHQHEQQYHHHDGAYQTQQSHVSRGSQPAVVASMDCERAVHLPGGTHVPTVGSTQEPVRHKLCAAGLNAYTGLGLGTFDVQQQGVCLQQQQQQQRRQQYESMQPKPSWGSPQQRAQRQEHPLSRQFDCQQGMLRSQTGCDSNSMPRHPSTAIQRLTQQRCHPAQHSTAQQDTSAGLILQQPAVIKQQQQPRRTDAASCWSNQACLSSVNRVRVAQPGQNTAYEQPPHAQPKHQRGSTTKALVTPAAAAAAAKEVPSVAVGKGLKGSKGVADPVRAGRGKGSSLTVEFVPGPADPEAQQPRLHQSTLQDALKRADRKKQQQLLPVSSPEGASMAAHQMQQQDSIAHQQAKKAGFMSEVQAAEQQARGEVRPPPVARKRKRSAAAAAADPGKAAHGGSDAGSTGSGGSGRGGSGKAARSSKVCAALDSAVEILDIHLLLSSSSSGTTRANTARAHMQSRHPAMLDASSPASAAWQELQQLLPSAEAVALGLLYCRVVTSPSSHSTTASAVAPPLAMQYFSSLQPLHKRQQVLLGKAATFAKRQADASRDTVLRTNTNSCPPGPNDLSTSGMQHVVGLAVMPVSASSSSSAATNPTAVTDSSVPGACWPMFFIHFEQKQLPNLEPHVAQLLLDVLCDPKQRPCLCCNAKSVLCSLSDLGWQLPSAGSINLVDPELLGWLEDPQLIQDTKQETCYSLDQQLGRHGMQVAAEVEALGPLQRLHQQLLMSLQLTHLLYTQLDQGGAITGQAIKLEMQVAAVLARMEACGVAVRPSVLSCHRVTLAHRLATIKARAEQLVGFDFNLSSSTQLAKVLYEHLRLVPPAGGGRGSAKTHAPTNEAVLRQLAASHDLPGLVLEYRCITNVMTKWIDAQWVQQADNAPGGRVHCTWQQTSTATGRLSSCSPNLQAVTKYDIDTGGSGVSGAAAGAAKSVGLVINVRDAFVAPADKLLLSADYSQIELRLLAHFSEDQLLCRILSQTTGDVFTMIAAELKAAVLQRQRGMSAGVYHADMMPQVSAEERERAKRVVYGIVYGLTPYGLAQQLSDQGVSTAAAQGMIDSFLARFPGVRTFMSRSISAARAEGRVSTLMGRQRPLAGLAGDVHDRQAAERKVVNSQIQGSAADLIKLAMCSWDRWAAHNQQQQQHGSEQPAADDLRSRPCARLIAQIHDELLFEVDAPDAAHGPEGTAQHPGQHFLHVAAAVQQIMEHAAPLSVPLKVKLTWGHSWGSLSDLRDLGITQ